MKSLIAASLVLASSLAFASDDYVINSKIVNKTKEEVVIGISTQYDAQRDSLACKRFGIPDGQFGSSLKTIQRIYFIRQDATQTAIPKQYGFCKYTLTHVRVGVYSTGMVANMEERADEKVDTDVYEFKGSTGGSAVAKKDDAGLNSLKCTKSTYNGIVFNCDKADNQVFDNGSKLDLNVEASK